jgi:hypothetical protein
MQGTSRTYDNRCTNQAVLTPKAIKMIFKFSDASCSFIFEDLLFMKEDYVFENLNKRAFSNRFPQKGFQTQRIERATSSGATRLICRETQHTEKTV